MVEKKSQGGIPNRPRNAQVVSPWHKYHSFMNRKGCLIGYSGRETGAINWATNCIQDPESCDPFSRWGRSKTRETIHLLCGKLPSWGDSGEVWSIWSSPQPSVQVTSARSAPQLLHFSWGFSSLSAYKDLQTYITATLSVAYCVPLPNRPNLKNKSNREHVELTRPLNGNQETRCALLVSPHFWQVHPCSDGSSDSFSCASCAAVLCITFAKQLAPQVCNQHGINKASNPCEVYTCSNYYISLQCWILPATVKCNDFFIYIYIYICMYMCMCIAANCNTCTYKKYIYIYIYSYSYSCWHINISTHTVSYSISINQLAVRLGAPQALQPPWIPAMRTKPPESFGSEQLNGFGQVLGCLML